MFLNVKMSLHEICGFNELIKHYEANRDRKWSEWLDFEKVLPRAGKQGLVGIFRLKENSEIQFAFKLSQYINYLAIHEHTVMHVLRPLTKYCPHFLRSVGLISATVESDFKKTENPFCIVGKHPIDKEVMLMEYLDRTSKFYNYIHDTKWNEQIYYSIIKQTLMSLFLSQKYNFTHYDLHSNNILVKKCDREMVFVYVKNKKAYTVPTYGYYPVIIDYGFAYSEGMNKQPLWASMGHTDIGFTSNRFDPIADPKLFLVSVANEIHSIHCTDNSKTLLNITKNLFYKLPIDWECGWDKETRKSVSDSIIHKLKKYTVSKLFRDYDCYCIDILQTLITLPLKPQNTNDLFLSYTTFQKEFLKIEHQISSPFYTLYVLKGIVDLARNIYSDYICKETRETALEYFRTNFYVLINTIGDFCNPKDIHFEKMVCSLYCLSKSIEGIMFKVSSDLEVEKEKNYSELPVTDINEIWNIIETCIPHTYSYTVNTTLFVMDQDTENYTTFTLQQDQVTHLNNLETIEQGDYLYQIYNTQVPNKDG